MGRRNLIVPIEPWRSASRSFRAVATDLSRSCPRMFAAPRFSSAKSAWVLSAANRCSAGDRDMLCFLIDARRAWRSSFGQRQAAIVSTRLDVPVVIQTMWLAGAISGHSPGGAAISSRRKPFQRSPLATRGDGPPRVRRRPLFISTPRILASGVMAHRRNRSRPVWTARGRWLVRSLLRAAPPVRAPPGTEKRQATAISAADEGDLYMVLGVPPATGSGN